MNASLPTVNLIYGATLAYGLGFVGAYGITEAVQVGKSSIVPPKK